MSDVLLRQWSMLRAVPRAPRWIAPEKLREKLSDEGMDITMRSVQRDLNALSATFPLICDDAQRPHRWSWAASAPVSDIPGMEPSTALTFNLVESFIPHLLPPQIRDHLGGHFERAEQVLAGTSSFRHWHDRICVLNRGMSLLAPETPIEVTRVVYAALLQDRQFRAHYRPRERSADEPREYVVNPLGLVVRDNVIYLVCTLWNYNDIRQLVLHRIGAAELLDDPVRRPEGFKLDAYVRSGAFDVLQGKDIRLVALFLPQAAFHLHETPLSDDQRISEQGGWMQVSATVRDTSQLRWWLLALGEQAEVLRPKALRREIAAVARSMAANYGSVEP